MENAEQDDLSESLEKMRDALLKANKYLADMAARGGPRPGQEGVDQWADTQQAISDALEVGNDWLGEPEVPVQESEASGSQPEVKPSDPDAITSIDYYAEVKQMTEELWQKAYKESKTSAPQPEVTYNDNEAEAGEDQQPAE